MPAQDDARSLAQAVLIAAGGFLGEGESLRTLEVELFSVEQRAVVWADLRDNSVECQLRAIESFFAVQECYEDELQLDLRFGQAAEHSARAAYESLVLAH